MSPTKVALRNLVYKLCEPREVPLLVTDIIAEYSVHQDLFKINVLSRDLNAEANAIIYRDTAIHLDGTDPSVKIAFLLMRTLLTSDSAIQAIRTFSLVGDPLRDWRNRPFRGESTEDRVRGLQPPGILVDLADFTEHERELCNDIMASSPASVLPAADTVSLWALCLHVFRLATCIQDFRVSSDYFRFPDFRDALQDMAQDLSKVRLQSCDLCSDLLQGEDRHPSVVEHWDHALLALFAVPNIQSVTAVVSLGSEAVRQLPPGSTSITRLDLHHYQSQNYDLSALLAATPCLKYLKYHSITDYGWHGLFHREQKTTGDSVALAPFYDALHHVSHSLEELHISQIFDEDSCHFDRDYAGTYRPQSRQRGELSSLERLHTLTMPYNTLLGWTPQTCSWQWEQLLPSTLRRIILTDDLHESCWWPHWTDKDLVPIFTGLLAWLSAAQQGSGVAEFELHLANLDECFNKPVRQELTEICEELGVCCTIKKARADRQPTPRISMPRGGRRGGLNGRA